jgi:triosephosphate isomerase
MRRLQQRRDEKNHLQLQPKNRRALFSQKLATFRKVKTAKRAIALEPLKLIGRSSRSSSNELNVKVILWTVTNCWNNLVLQIFWFKSH